MHVNDALGEAGAPLPCVIGDKTYRLSPLTKRRQATIEAWLYERAQKAAVAMRTLLSEGEYTNLLYKLGKDKAAGEFDFGGTAYKQAMGTWEGVCRVLHAVLSPNHPELTPESVGDLYEANPIELRAGLNTLMGAYLERHGLDAEGKPLPPKGAAG